MIEFSLVTHSFMISSDFQKIIQRCKTSHNETEKLVSDDHQYQEIRIQSLKHSRD